MLVRRLAAMIVDSPAQISDRDGGIIGLRDALLESLDVDGHSDPPQQDIQADARKFCRDRCYYSDDGPPGEHLVCKACELKKHTIDPFEGAAEGLASEAIDERKRKRS